jgi:adenylylsulfate kinase
MHTGSVDREARERLLDQTGSCVWFTGLSGSGKSTISRALESELTAARKLTYVLDGDNLRHGLNSDLGFSAADREENIRRVAEVAALLVDAGLIVLTAFISPFRADRDKARAVIGKGRFVEVYVDTPIEVCERRDPKGLYQKARRGDIPDFTGITSPYEAPLAAELTLHADDSVAAAAQRVFEYLDSSGLLRAGSPTSS